MSLRKFLPFSLALMAFCSLGLGAAALAQGGEQESDDFQINACLSRIGGAERILDKEIVTGEPINQEFQILESSIPGPYRINFPGEPLSAELNPDRITISVDSNNIVTDAECL